MATDRKRISPEQLEFPGLSEWVSPARIVAGVDEVGRGALFGPVVAAAVILPDSVTDLLTAAGVTDSKQLTADQRRVLAVQIRELAVDCRIGYASVAEIDRLNILQASLLAMKRAILRLSVPPELCLIDGNQQVPGLPFAQQPVIKGDSRFLTIAAASIVAKVWRDELITRMAERYPQYHLPSNKGYGTPPHRLALQTHGPTRYHRQSFEPCRVKGEGRGDREIGH